MLNLALYEQHDLAVLRAVAELTQVGSYPYRAHEAADMAGLDSETTHRALARLSDAGMIRGKDASTFDHDYRLVDPILGLTEKGLRVAGAWPNAESIIDQIIERLAEAAKDAEPAEAEGYRRTARGLAMASRDIAVAATAAVLAGKIG